jgi:hypothetical protein
MKARSWLMPAQSAGPRSRRMVTDAPAFFRSKRHAAIFGCAPITDPMLSCDGLARAQTRQAFQEAHLLALREALASTAKHLRNQMRCSEASLAMAELRAVTHAILAQGER